VIRRLRDQSGFSLAEVMVAVLVLLIGAGAAFTLIDSANRAVTSNSARVGATNLTRELTEYARGTDYDLLQPAQVVTALRKHNAIAGTLASGVWKIQRRNVTYTVETSSCIFDDPKDGLATTPIANACPTPAAVAGAPAESNPDDFRRITFKLSWNARSRAGSYTQSTLIVNPAGGLGPRITRFDQPASQYTGNSATWGGVSTLRLTSTGAASVHWASDDGISAGDASGGSTDWGFTWNFGTAFDPSNPWVRDGAYVVNAQAFDSRGVPGEARIVTVYVNRHAPAAVTDFAGGYNSTRGIVDMRWSRYDERDLQGYRVVRLADNKQICPASGSVQDALSCTDTAPIPSTYAVYAVDCTDLAAANCVYRLGTASNFTMASVTAGTAPGAPTGLTASVVDGKPTLSWTAPASVPNGPIRFYRIYRDTGTGLSDRYDETVTSSPNYVDPKPGATTSHRYWVTAVDQDFNESAPSAFVDSPPVTP
jgi:prepilin-type N-terminal cleavage/methylation domain-containing protein